MINLSDPIEARNAKYLDVARYLHMSRDMFVLRYCPVELLQQNMTDWVTDRLQILTSHRFWG